jgi:hypothetical protein
METVMEPQAAYAALVADDALGRAVITSNLQHGFVQIPDRILSHPRIPRRAKLVYAALLKYARQQARCWPTQETLAADCSMSVDTVYRGLKDLRSLIYRVDPVTHEIVIETACEACQALQAQEPNAKKRRRIHCGQHSYGLVQWKQRGLNKSNVYQIVPLFASLEELEAQLAQAEQAEQGGDDQVTSSGNPQEAESRNRIKPDQKTAQCGTNHIETEDSYQGNRDSNSNASKEGVSYSQEQVAIGIQTPQLNPPSSPTNALANRNPNPPNSAQSAGAVRAKAATGHTIEQHLQAVRALAAAGVDVRHYQELERQFAPEPPAADYPLLSPMLNQLVRDCSTDFNDGEHVTSNLTRAAKIADFCERYYGDSEDKVIEFFYEARRKAKRAAVQDRTGSGKPARMKYFFTVLENAVGYRQHCPKCGEVCRPEPTTNDEAFAYHWVCGHCGHDFVVVQPATS